MGMRMRMRIVLSVYHPKVLTPEEDEEQLIMRRMRNSVDELRRGYRFLFIILISFLIIDIIICIMVMSMVLFFVILLSLLATRWLDYRMQRVKTKANDSKDIREGIELFEEKVINDGTECAMEAMIVHGRLQGGKCYEMEI